MPININYSKLAQGIKIINNPSLPVGTLIEEIPSDIGRSYAGYKRGGFIEAAEKMRKELMSAAVWIFGIPFFNLLGNLFCEHALKIPTKNIDFSNAKMGNDSILNTAKYLVSHGKDKIEGLDYSELDHFIKKINKGKLDFSKTTAQDLAKRISGAKKVTSIAAVILNCAAMGFIIPKVNQYFTKKLLDKQKISKSMQNFVSFDDFQKSNKKAAANDISFTAGIPKCLRSTNDFVYAIENDNRTRLVITDIPMILGRMITSRNKYEALEYLVMDGLSSYFYNFASEHTQKLLRGKVIPNTQLISVETLVNNPEQFKSGLEKIKENPEIFKLKTDKPDTILKNIFGDGIAKEIYKNETYGKYGKANRFIEDDTIKTINKNIEGFINHLKSQAEKQNTKLFVDDKLNVDFITKTAKKLNRKNALFLGLGLGVSIFGLAILIPKLTFGLTKLLTGRNEFAGITNYDDDKNKKA